MLTDLHSAYPPPPRLVCEGTVEENVLKKANQKRMLGELAIESGAFTTEFFTEVSLVDLQNKCSSCCCVVSGVYSCICAGKHQRVVQ